MKRILLQVFTGIIVIAGIVLSIIFRTNFSYVQKGTLRILFIIMGASALFCFLVGEISRNNSQMDKLWSVLPIAYAWVVLIKSNFNFRVLIFTIIVTLWGIRLTYNFARKGAYSIKFWSGKEDYRWEYLRSTKYFKNKFVWAVFDLFFVSFYQNFIVLAITLPAVAFMESRVAFNYVDIIVTVLAIGFLTLETVADEYQWKFHKEKKKQLDSGKQLTELLPPYNKGFNTTGIWAYMRHPNYLGEQGIWFTLYFFCLGAKVTSHGIFNITFIGSLLLILLFMGSSTLGENITKSKYEEYSKYQQKVLKYLPIRKYN